MSYMSFHTSMGGNWGIWDQSGGHIMKNLGYIQLGCSGDLGAGGLMLERSGICQSWLRARQQPGVRPGTPDHAVSVLARQGHLCDVH